MRLQIEMERNFLVDEEKQWSWHKSWNLPNISISLEVNKLINILFFHFLNNFHNLLFINYYS
jgi:hypothetical protein